MTWRGENKRGQGESQGDAMKTDANGAPLLTRFGRYALGFVLFKPGVASAALRDPAATFLAVGCLGLVLAVQFLSFLLRGGRWPLFLMSAAEVPLYWFLQAVLLHRLTQLLLDRPRQTGLHTTSDFKQLIPYLRIAGFAAVTYLVFLLGFTKVPREALRALAMIWMVLVFRFGLKDGLGYTSQMTWVVAGGSLLALEVFQAILRYAHVDF
jgi:hypothetical protein